MPEKLLCPSYGISKSLLNQITATENDIVIGKSFLGSDGILKTGNIPDRGQYQYAQKIYIGSDYIALEDFPEGLYRKNGESWAPEIRLEKSKYTQATGKPPIPVYAFSCTGGRQANPMYNSEYVQASGLGSQWKGSTGTIRIVKPGYYTAISSHYREVSSSPRFVFAGNSYYDSASAGGYLNAGDTIMIYLPGQEGQGYFWSYGIGICYNE